MPDQPFTAASRPFTHPIYIAARADDALLERMVPVWHRRLDAFYGLSGRSCARISRSPGLMLMSFDPVDKQIDIPLGHIDARVHAVSVHPMPVATPSPEAARTGRYLAAFVSRISGAAADIETLPPPVNYAWHNVASGRLLLANDSFGAGKIYRAVKAGMDVFSNRIGAVALVLGEIPATDPRAWSHYAAYDWVLDDCSFFQGVELMTPGRRVYLTADQCKVAETHSIGSLIRRAAAGEIARPDPVAAAREIIAAAARLAGGRPLAIGLTGGRDSRAIAALAREAGVATEYHTLAPPELEQDLAQQLVSASRQPMVWHALPHNGAEVAVTDLATRAEHWFHRVEGDSWPIFLRFDPQNGPRDFEAFGDRVMLSGQGGEITRNHFYDSRHLDQGRTRITAYLREREGANPLLTPACRQETLRTLRAVMMEGHEAGLDGLHLLDWVYLRSQQRRRVPTSHARGSFFPLYTAAMAIEAFLGPVEDKIAARTLGRIIHDQAPDWRGIPFFADLAPTLPRAQTDKTLVLPFYWETAHRDGLFDLLEAGLAASDAYVTDALDQFRRIGRDDRLAVLFQSAANRILWRVGFEIFRRNLSAALAADASGPEPAFDSAISAPA